MTTTTEVDASVIKSRSEEELLLREMAHRMLNEIASALAALHLLRRGAGSSARDRLIDEAISRLTHLADVSRILAAPVREAVDVGGIIERLVPGLVGGRPDLAGCRVRLSLPSLIVEADLARRIALVCSELVSNAVRHSLSGRRGRLGISLRLDGDQVVLEVRDDGRGARPAGATGTGWGSGIVAELVERGDGEIASRFGARGAKVVVRLPLARGRTDDDVF